MTEPLNTEYDLGIEFCDAEDGGLTDCGMFGCDIDGPAEFTCDFDFGSCAYLDFTNDAPEGSGGPAANPRVHDNQKDCADDDMNATHSSSVNSAASTTPSPPSVDTASLSSSSSDSGIDARNGSAEQSDRHPIERHHDHESTDDLISGEIREHIICEEERSRSSLTMPSEAPPSGQRLSTGSVSHEAGDRLLLDLEIEPPFITASNITQKTTEQYALNPLLPSDSKSPAFDEENLSTAQRRGLVAWRDHIAIRMLRKGWLRHLFCFMLGAFMALAWNWVMHGWRPVFWARTAEEQARWCRSTRWERLML